MRPPYPAKYSQAKQGGRHLHDANNYIYRRHGASNCKIFYQCVLHKTQNCNASASVDKSSDMVVQLNGVHNHDTDTMKKEIDQVVQDAVRIASNTLETPINVLGMLLFVYSPKNNIK